MKITKCPYFPTRSEYGLEAVSKYGALKGGFLAFWRICRCNPFQKVVMILFLNIWGEVKHDLRRGKSIVSDILLTQDTGKILGPITNCWVILWKVSFCD